MSMIKLLKEEFENSNVELKVKISELDLVESPDQFILTTCCNACMIEETYANMRNIIKNVNSIGTENYETNKVASDKMEEVDIYLSDKIMN